MDRHQNTLLRTQSFADTRRREEPQRRLSVKKKFEIKRGRAPNPENYHFELISTFRCFAQISPPPGGIRGCKLTDYRAIQEGAETIKTH